MNSEVASEVSSEEIYKGEYSPSLEKDSHSIVYKVSQSAVGTFLERQGSNKKELHYLKEF